MRTILIADDSTTVHRVVEHAFSGFDVRVVAAADGRSAVELARREHPDIALCDVLMPGFSGYEVAEVFAGDPGLGNIPVLLLTGAFEPFDEGRATRCGAVGFLTKPFESSVLRRKVDEILGARAAPPADPAVRAAAAHDAAIPAIPAPPASPWFAAPRHENPLELPAGEEQAGVVRGDGADWREVPPPLPGEEGFDFSIPPTGPIAMLSPPPHPDAGREDHPPADGWREECRRQVAALAPDIVREVAWEVVPDLLERLVREAAPSPPPARPPAGDDKDRGEHRR